MVQIFAQPANHRCYLSCFKTQRTLPETGQHLRNSRHLPIAGAGNVLAIILGRAAALGRSCRVRVLERFSESDVITRLRGVYAELPGAA